MENQFYTYIYLNPLKHGKFIYGKISFDYEPFYVGKGKSDRIKVHIREANNTTKSSHKLNTIRKIIREGSEPIIIKIIEDVDEKTAVNKEIELIWVIGRVDLNMGPLTNKTWGGDGISGYKHTEETKRKISLKFSGKNHPNYGRIVPDSQKESQREKMSGENHPFFGKSCSEERRKNISKANKGKKRSENTKKILSEIASKRTGIKNSNYGNRGEKNSLFGKKWFNNNVEEGRFIEATQPSGWVAGRLKSK